MSDMQRIERAWLSFREKVIPRDAPAVQLQEMRRAFYAGTWALYAELMVMFDSDREPTEDDLRRMSAVVAEMERFRDRVKAGLA